MLHYFTDLEYAQKKKAKIGYGDLVGVKFDQHDESAIEFLGYDLIDGSSNISLLTNWGNDVEIINQAISSAGLVRSWAVIEEIQKELFKSHGDDAHVDGCTIVSLYKPKDSPFVSDLTGYFALKPLPVAAQ